MVSGTLQIRDERSRVYLYPIVTNTDLRRFPDIFFVFKRILIELPVKYRNVSTTCETTGKRKILGVENEVP